MINQLLRSLTLLLPILLFVAPSQMLPEAQADEPKATPPNILLIFLDDFGWKDTSYMGSDFYETPNIDALASQGMTFTNAYSCSANCAPARASLMSGQYTPRHQVYNVGTKPRGKSAYRRLEHIPGVATLDPKIKTWAQQLQTAGYRTATMGKWHLSDDPLPYGFDVNIGGTHSGGPPNGYYPPHGKAPGLDNAPPDEYITDRLSDEACKFITASKDKPWMLYLTHFAVHTPIQAKKELLEKYKAKQPGQLHDNVKMATMIQAVDDGVGKIVATLEELGIRDNTVIMFYSDNGGYGPATDMDPLKGYKGTYFEGGIRVPFFVNWPGVVKPKQTSDEPIIGVDLYPTLCEIGGASLPEGQVGDGVSLVSLFKGQVENLNQDSQPRELFWHFPAYLQSYQGVHDEQRDPLFRARPCGVIRKGKWKLIQYFESGELELYDLESDLAETTNVATSNLAIADELFLALKDWQSQTKAAIPQELNPKFNAAKESAAIEKLKSRAERQKRGVKKQKAGS
ncbi:sulfatase [Mariniblastus sp.]|nr:sulfatase [Mariniblastus sp.]